MFRSFSGKFSVCSFIILTVFFISNFCDTRVSRWGEICESPEECGDHRYACEFDETEKRKKCVCDRFYEWRGLDTGCVLIYNISSILKVLNVKATNEDNTEKNNNATQNVFIAQIAAGYFVLTVVIVSILAVGVFCLKVRRNDLQLKHEVQRLKSRKRKSFAQQLETQ